MFALGVLCLSGLVAHVRSNLLDLKAEPSPRKLLFRFTGGPVASSSELVLDFLLL